MAIPTDLLPTTCDVYRPFGDAAPTTAASRAGWSPTWPAGGGRTATGLAWTHYLVLERGAPTSGTACTRAAGAQAQTYADGDEVRVSAGPGSWSCGSRWSRRAPRGSSSGRT